jgi:hypothetical protein
MHTRSCWELRSEGVVAGRRRIRRRVLFLELMYPTHQSPILDIASLRIHQSPNALEQGRSITWRLISEPALKKGALYLYEGKCD